MLASQACALDPISTADVSIAAPAANAPIDSNGNLASDGLTSYSWNARNQLTGLSGGTSASFAYDGFGRRRGKTVGGTTTNFLYDGVNSVQEQASGGTPTANLLTGLGIDETFTRSDGTGTSTLLVDALGSTLELADASGTLQSHYTYEPFGATTASGSSSGNAAEFTGRENDGTGLYYYRARFYSPQFQRLIGEDPLGFAGGTNLFAYAAGNPISYGDPLGLKPPTGFGPNPRGPGGLGPTGAGPGRRGPGGSGPGGNGPGGDGPGGHCDAICQLAFDIDRQAGFLNDPRFYYEFYKRSFLGGAAAGSLGELVTLLREASIATDIEAFQFMQDVTLTQQPLSYTPPTTPGSTAGNIINIIRQYFGL